MEAILAKQKKVRVDFRKNRQNRTRENDLTRSFGSEKGTDLGAKIDERIRAKGDLSRKRTIVVEETSEATGDEDATARMVVDLVNCIAGRVIRVHGLESVVESETGERYRCGVRRILKTLSIDGRNVVAVGDRVWIRPGGGDQGLIEKVDARHGTITRGYRHREHVIVANIDQLLVVAALAEPELKLPLIDRYIISAEKGGVRPIIVLNKSDLVSSADYQWVVGLYTQLGYETILASAETGQGIERLREILITGTTAFSGQSGVGKSSLLNAIQPGLNLRIGEVSEWTNKGKHTTTYAELIRLDQGGYVVDTPGLRQFDLWRVDPAEIEGYFIEFRAYIPRCKFPDCSHTHESECSVREAVDFGQIQQCRYESYLKLYHGEVDE
jgi:ribosome biogenesis GTPase / thiamine phosphate phosphatase